VLASGVLTPVGALDMLLPMTRRESWSRLAACAAGLALAACSGPGSAPSPSPGRGQTVKIQTGVNPAGVAVAGGYAWVANSGEGTVSKIDVATNRVVGKVVVGDPGALVACQSRNVHQTPHGDFRIRNCDLPKAVAVSPGAVWAGNGDTKSLVRIDPAAGRVVDTIAVGVEPWFIAASDSAVWLADWRTDTVVRVDPATNEVVATLTNLAYGPTGIAIAPGSVWVANSRANLVTKIDSTTNQVVATYPTDLTPLPVLYAHGSVWVRNEFREGDGTVQRFDPGTGQVVASIPVGPVAGRDGLDGLADLDGGVWVAGLETQEIDPASNRVVRTINHTSNAVSSGAGSLWSIDIAYAISRITP
jgi:YVTN family beta-propeller protein